MAIETQRSAASRPRAAARGLIAAVVAVAVGWGGVVYAANQSVQGAKKEEGGFDGDAPTAILIEATSGSVLFEKNADELRAPSSMMKLMTAEVVFHAIKQGDVKLDRRIPHQRERLAQGRRAVRHLDDVRGDQQQGLGRRSPARRASSRAATTPASRWPRAWPATRTSSPPTS